LLIATEVKSSFTCVNNKYSLSKKQFSKNKYNNLGHEGLDSNMDALGKQ